MKGAPPAPNNTYPSRVHRIILLHAAGLLPSINVTVEGAKASYKTRPDRRAQDLPSTELWRGGVEYWAVKNPPKKRGFIPISRPWLAGAHPTLFCLPYRGGRLV